MGSLFSSDSKDDSEYKQYEKYKPEFEKYEKKKKAADDARKISLAKIGNINIKYEILSSFANALYYMIFIMFSYIILSFCSHCAGEGLSNWVLIILYSVLWFFTIFINFSDSDKTPNGIWAHSWGWLFVGWLILIVVVPIVSLNLKPSFGPDLLGITNLGGEVSISESIKERFIKTKDEGFASKIVVIGLLLHILTIIYYSFSWDYPTQNAIKTQTVLHTGDPSLFT